MIILAIETSCDETSISILQDSDIDKRILSLVTRSQVSVHQDYGGVVPELAARAHLSNIEPIMEQALAQAKIELKDIDAANKRQYENERIHYEDLAVQFAKQKE